MSLVPGGYKVHARSEWTGTSPGGEPQRLTTASTLFVHTSAGAADSVNSAAEAEQWLRNIRKYHVEQRGWDDIAYGYAIFQPNVPWRRPRIYRLRGARRIPASQIGCNRGNTSVVVIGRGTESVHWLTKAYIRQLWRDLPCGKIAGHRECSGSATDCPGDKLTATVTSLRKAGK